MTRQRDFRSAAFKRTDDSSLNMAVNGSTTAYTFRVTPGANEAWAGSTVLIAITDATGWPALGFGAQATALGSGLLFRKRELTGPSDVWSWTLKRNIELFERFDRKTADDFSDSRLVAVFKLEPPEDIGFLLDDKNVLEFVVQDDLTFLDRLRAALIYGVHG